MKCFATAAKANIEDALARFEYLHTCDPLVIERFKAVSQD
jgi:hypothetical protein